MNKNKVLYLGLDPKNFKTEGILFHYPLIKIVPLPIKKESLKATHLLLTSKTAASLFFENFKGHFCIVAIGKNTASLCESLGQKVSIVAKNETQEGVIEELEKRDLKEAKFCYPHAKKVRPLLKNYLEKRSLLLDEIILYETLPNDIVIPDLSVFDEIVFTSSSTVEAFILRYKTLPKNKKLTALGPITQKTLENYL